LKRCALSKCDLLNALGKSKQMINSLQSCTLQRRWGILPCTLEYSSNMASYYPIISKRGERNEKMGEKWNFAKRELKKRTGKGCHTGMA
jgi:hypothetical protein